MVKNKLGRSLALALLCAACASETLDFYDMTVKDFESTPRAGYKEAIAIQAVEAPYDKESIRTAVYDSLLVFGLLGDKPETSRYALSVKVLDLDQDEDGRFYKAHSKITYRLVETRTGKTAFEKTYEAHAQDDKSNTVDPDVGELPTAARVTLAIIAFPAIGSRGLRKETPEEALERDVLAIAIRRNLRQFIENFVNATKETEARKTP